MSDKSKVKRAARIRRHVRVRKAIRGTAERPRLAVFRSNRHIVVQVIDDVSGRTLASAASHEATLRSGASNRDGAAAVGRAIADRAQAAGVTTVVFDRGGNAFHGRVAAVAEAARDAGLEF